MFDRFTDPSREIMGLARQHAVRLQHDWIGSVHILLALLEEPRGVAGRVLRERGLSIELTTQAVAALTPPDGPVEAGSQLPFTPDAKQILEGAAVVADQPGDRRIDTEHLLLGLVADSDSAACRVLVALDADPEQLKLAVFEVLKGKPARSAPSVTPATAWDGDGLAVVGGAALSSLRAACDLIGVLQRSNPDLQRAADLAQQALSELGRQVPAER